MNAESRKTTIALCGYMASGKTTVGKILAERLGYDFVDTDEMLLEETGMTLPEMFARGGEAYFRDLEHETVKRAARLPRTVISTGGGVMTFERNALVLAEHAEIIHIVRPFEVCYAAISQRTDRPIAGRKTPEQMRAMYDSRIAAYEKHAGLTLSNDGTPEDAAQRVIDWLRG